ncbi:signal recognition particle receptor subunit beta [Pelomyxa schiedti]|nr:signal recognition particle receptor subunit beta [Pelomyxa schiedti]
MMLGCIQWSSHEVAATIGTIVVVAILSLILLWRRRRGTQSRSVVLTGLSNAGKTALILRLQYPEVMNETHMSMEPHSATFPIKKDSKQRILKMTDSPGHDRVRGKWIEFASSANALVYVLNSLDFNAQVRDEANFLLSILSNPVTMKNKIPICVFCNKQEQISASLPEKVKVSLEHEIQQVLALKPLSIGEHDSAAAPTPQLLQAKEKDFSFSALLHNKVVFVGGSVEQPNLHELQDFLLSF